MLLIAGLVGGMAPLGPIGLVGAAAAYAQTPDGTEAPEVRVLAESEFEAIRLQKVLTAVRITEEITLDGRFDEPAWQRVGRAFMVKVTNLFNF